MQELLRPDSSIAGAVELMQHGSFRALGKDNETCTVVSAGENFANTCAEVCAMVACLRPKVVEAKTNLSPILHIPDMIGIRPYVLSPPVVLRCRSAGRHLKSIDLSNGFLTRATSATCSSHEPTRKKKSGTTGLLI